MSERVSVKLIPVVFNHSWGMRTPAQTINRPAAAVSVRNKTKIKCNASSGLHFLEITLTPFFSFFFCQDRKMSVSPFSCLLLLLLLSSSLSQVTWWHPPDCPTGTSCTWTNKVSRVYLLRCMLFAWPETTDYRVTLWKISESPLSDPQISADNFYFTLFCSNFIILNGTIQIIFLHWVKAIQGTEMKQEA